MKTLLSWKRATLRSILRWIIPKRCFASFSARRIAVRSVKDAVKDRNKMANGHGGEDYYKTARAEKKGRLRDFAIHVTPSCRVLSHAPLGFINVRHNSAMYIYIYFFFLFVRYKSPWKNIFPLFLLFLHSRGLLLLIGWSLPPHRGEHVYACKTLYHIFSFTLLFCFLIFFFFFVFVSKWMEY